MHLDKICSLACDIFIISNSPKSIIFLVALEVMGNAPTKKGDPENGTVNFAGASVVVLSQARKPSCF